MVFQRCETSLSRGLCRIEAARECWIRVAGAKGSSCKRSVALALCVASTKSSTIRSCLNPCKARKRDRERERGGCGRCGVAFLPRVAPIVDPLKRVKLSLDNLDPQLKQVLAASSRCHIFPGTNLRKITELEMNPERIIRNGARSYFHFWILSLLVCFTITSRFRTLVSITGWNKPGRESYRLISWIEKCGKITMLS